MKNETNKIKYKRIFKEDENIDPTEDDQFRNVNFITKLLEILAQIKVFHWQTFSFEIHNSLNTYYDEMSELIDTFVETSFGNDGRKATIGGIALMDYEENKCVTYVNDTLIYLERLRKDMTGNTDLENIIDEMIGKTNHLRYFLSLK